MTPRLLVVGLLVGCLPVPAVQAQQKKEVPAGTSVTILVKPAEPEKPPLALKLNGREARAMPQRCGFAPAGGGNIDVQQPAPDTIVITVTGVAVAGGHPCRKSSAILHADLTQCFEVVFEKTEVKNPKLTLEGRVIGLLRSHCKGGGCASESGWAALACAAEGEALTIQLPANTACKGENRSINDHEGPCGAPVRPGKYVLKAQFEVSATHPCGLGKTASAEFAPDPALDPLWIDYKEPFHGIAKKDFGFQLTIKVMEEVGPANGNGTEENKPVQPEKLPPPGP